MTKPSHALIVSETAYTINEVCAFVGCSKSKYYALKRLGCWPIPEIQPALGHARFSGFQVIAYLRGDFAAPRVSARRHLSLR